MWMSLNEPRLIRISHAVWENALCTHQNESYLILGERVYLMSMRHISWGYVFECLPFTWGKRIRILTTSQSEYLFWCHASCDWVTAHSARRVWMSRTMCDTTRSDSFICDTTHSEPCARDWTHVPQAWLIHMGHDSFIWEMTYSFETRLIQTHSY